ncbi:MarR family winged helix-turn-helix transcriptional regulator [Devosia sp.]|uniref:MarR family winged helix-turn-helix transcriptional regulator n=1 Tax=Devosia sp. TaxID=1871048 RepID=UPI001ACDE97F|nr:MarR family winged helix-turn-helix transcriptional regulator [Devosia sp.]MBN9334311.1 winged helix-turn-helix transcriptional regulator [Devosia sp.]
MNTRMAARAVTRRADRKLRGFGVTSAQFNILGVLSTGPAASITDMAADLAMDRTTLSRNLAVLERRKLVSTGAGEHARMRSIELTPEGRRIFESILPEWRNSQEELRNLLTNPDFQTTLDGLRHLAKL